MNNIIIIQHQTCGQYVFQKYAINVTLEDDSCNKVINESAEHNTYMCKKVTQCLLKVFPTQYYDIFYA